MKKAVIILLIIMTVSYIVAGVLLGIQLRNINELETIIMDINKEEEIEISEKIKTIIFDSNIVDIVNIYSTKEEKVKIELTGEYISLIKKELGINTVANSNNLYIEIYEKGFIKYIELIYSTELKLDIYIPESYNKKINVEELNYGNIHIQEEVQNKVTIEGMHNTDREDDDDEWEDWE